MAGTISRQDCPPVVRVGAHRTDPACFDPLAKQPHLLAESRGEHLGVGSFLPTAGDMVRLAVHAADPITRSALVSYVESQPCLALADRGTRADIVVAAVQSPDAHTLALLRQMAEDGARLLVIADGEWSVDACAAMAAGVRAVLFRSAFTWERFGRALQEVRAGHGDLPAELQGQLMDQMTKTHRDVLVPHGLTPGGLTLREAEILQLVSEGDELQEIGDKLGYSHRTIKNVLYSMIKRYQLRNRSHAVAYAIRNGQI
ncbi:response regulator transcription factor [Streptomyces sp. NPDC056716]|uniref:response regulator transcription factor n=1 Tax=unclassified Streptomyces TaxID=2593676 RepID=UPI0036C8678D